MCILCACSYFVITCSIATADEYHLHLQGSLSVLFK